MAKFCKSFNILLLILLLVASLIITGLGGWLIYENNLYLVIFGSDSVKILGYVVVTAGIILFITTIFGFCGIIKEAKVCTLLYLFVIVVGFILIVVSASLLFVYQNKVHDFLGHQALKGFIEKYGFDTSFTQSWDEIQSTLHCCGVSHGSDYKSSKWFNDRTADRSNIGNVPYTCCMPTYNGKSVDPEECVHEKPHANSTYIYNDGCLNKLNDKITKVAWYVGIILFVFCGIMLLIMVSGCVMYRAIVRQVSYGQVV